VLFYSGESMSAWRRISITRRVTWFTGAVAALLCALLAVTVMIAIHRYATTVVAQEVTAAGGRVAHQVEHGQVDMPLVEVKGRNIQIVDARGGVVLSTPQLRGKPVMSEITPNGRTITSAVVCGGVFRSACHIVVAQTAHRGGEDWIVYASTPAVPWYVAPWLAATVLGAAVLLAAAITLLGHRIVTASLKPVNAIRAELDQINETCPERKVPIPSSRDEIHELAGSINQTLARLNAAMRQQRTFTSDASHELRTPLAAIRAEVEDALYAPEESSVSALGNTVLRSVNRLELIVGDLLAMARLQAERPVAREPVDLAELVTAECERRPRTDKRLEYALEPDVTVMGDHTLLARLLSCLMDNAERHAATTITLRVGHSPAGKRDAQRFPAGIATLEVIDDGPGIAPDKRELVFQRFARLDTARGRDAGGIGLGLPIARQIAETHGGTLQIEDSPHGARFVLRLPIAP
jgi:signal transduction histidine kinase